MYSFILLNESKLEYLDGHPFYVVGYYKAFITILKIFCILKKMRIALLNEWNSNNFVVH